jgi:tellurium resistance protein TerD
VSDLPRGADVALTREPPTLERLLLGVRFGAAAQPTVLENTVLLTLLCDRDARLLSQDHAVFFNSLTDPDTSVENRSPAADGDTEQVQVALSAVPPAVHRIVLAAYVNHAFGARGSLAQLSECVVRAVDAEDGVELLRSQNLAPDWGPVAAAGLAEVYRQDAGWKFKVLGEGYAGGIVALAADHGLLL